MNGSVLTDSVNAVLNSLLFLFTSYLNKDFFGVLPNLCYTEQTTCAFMFSGENHELKAFFALLKLLTR